MSDLVDLHAHVIPGLDDGPATTAEAITLLRRLAADGVRTVIAAVHACDTRFRSTREAILVSHARLLNELPADLVGLTIIPSMEAGLTRETLTAAERNELLPIGVSRYVAIDTPADHLPHYTDRFLFELMLAGYVPILMHPERNHDLRDHPGRLAELIGRGAQAMVAAPSLLGLFGTGCQRAAQHFVRSGTAVLIASDAHDTGARAPLLAAGLEAAANCGKPDQAAELTVLAEHVLGGYKRRLHTDARFADPQDSVTAARPGEAGGTEYTASEADSHGTDESRGRNRFARSACGLAALPLAHHRHPADRGADCRRA